MKIRLSQQFTNDLNKFSNAIKIWRDGGVKELRRRYRIIGQLVKGQAQRRVPVASNRLKQGIITVTYDSPIEGLVTEVGTNVVSDKGFPYPVVLEFGSKHIAGGRVKALGEGADITDAEAIKIWPAKNAGLVDASGKANARLASAIQKRLAGGGAHEQMPFLRPAWNKVLPEAINLINGAMEPPSQRK